MASIFDQKKQELLQNTNTWLITGVAGFIGSNLLEALLKLNQKVVGLDNFITGKQENLEDVKKGLSSDQWKNFTLYEGDICSFEDCLKVTNRVDYVLHQAALGSVPRSLDDPLKTNEINVSGTLNVFVASRDNNVKRIVYAASSSTYGDHPDLPKIESKIGNPLSPYAVTKYVNELYADVFSKAYNLELIGLRYFNVFGRRQDPDGAYAAVIPKWIAAMIKGDPVIINGDGSTSRDFCYIQNVVQANLLAALTDSKEAINQVYNVACGERTDLNQLFEILREGLSADFQHLKGLKPEYREFRKGDVLHSLADVGKIESLLDYKTTHNIGQGLDEALGWYKENI